jgi:hypothetical protein
MQSAYTFDLADLLHQFDADCDPLLALITGTLQA